jgi:hypothetical protein
MHAITSSIAFFVGSSDAASAGTTPSPLKRVCAKIFVVSDASASEMAAASALPRSFRICRADARIAFLVVDLRERKRVAPGLERGEVLQVVLAPLDRDDDLRRPDAAVAVGVDERQRPFVELEPLDGARERGPQLLVEVLEVREVRGGLELRLVEPAGARELPTVRRGLCHGRTLCCAQGVARECGPF